MRESKVKVKKKKQKKSAKEIISGMLFAVIGLALAGGLFVGLMFLQNYFSDDITLKEVLVVKEPVAKGEIITEENAASYFESKSYNILNTPADAIEIGQIAELYGKKALVSLSVSETVAFKDFEDIDMYSENIDNPVEVSVAVSGAESSDGGKIRAGDFVNITLMFDKRILGKDGSVQSVSYEEGESEAPAVSSGSMFSVYNYSSYAQYVLQNVCIKTVLTADGQVIEPTDTTSVAGILVFVIPKDAELELNNALANCSSMRISRVLYDVNAGDYVFAPDKDLFATFSGEGTEVASEDDGSLQEEASFVYVLTGDVDVHVEPDKTSEIAGALVAGSEVTVVAVDEETGYATIEYDGGEGYVLAELIGQVSDDDAEAEAGDDDGAEAE